MSKVKVFYGASSNKIDELNAFLSTVKVIDVKYQMTDENDAFMVIYEDSNNLSEIPTCKLVEELMKREGVQSILVTPNSKYVLNSEVREGPAIILEVLD